MSTFLNDYFLVVAYALLPVVGHLTGAFIAECVKPPIAECVKPPRWVIGVALHCAAGIAIALVSIEFAPRVIGTIPVLAMALAFLVGGVLSIPAAFFVKKLKEPLGSRSTSSLAAYGAVSIDLVSDGLMTGAGSAVESRLGFLLGAVQSIANIPGGFAVSANLRHQQVSRGRRIGLAFSVAVPVIIAALAGLMALRGQSIQIQNLVLMGISGLLMLATIEDIIPEGDAPRPPRWLSSLAFCLGFIALILLSHYV